MQIGDNYDLRYFQRYRHHIFVRIMRKQWKCKLENSPVRTRPRGCFYKNMCSVPVCYNRYYSLKLQRLANLRKMAACFSSAIHSVKYLLQNDIRTSMSHNLKSLFNGTTVFSEKFPSICKYLQAVFLLNKCCISLVRNDMQGLRIGYPFI